MPLRYYQNEAVAAILGELMGVRATLLVMATGLGKTQTFTEVARTWPGNVLILAHRDELIEQARARVERETGEWVEVEKAEYRANYARIVVGSVQTLQNGTRLRRFKPDHFSLIIIDEAHRAPARSYQIIIGYFAKAKVLGVTATPDRSDGVAMGRTFQSVAYQFDIVDAIQDGWLVPIRGHRERIIEYDLSEVGTSKLTGGERDLAPGELDEAVVLATDAMVKRTLELYPKHKAIVFTPGVKSAQLAAEKLNLAKPGSAIVISGDTDPGERRLMVAQYKAGKYQYFCNCQIATEGADFPDVDLIVMMRSTLSRSLYMQMIGRGTRVLPHVVDALDGPEMAARRREAIAASPKPSMTVLDFVGNTGRHSPLTLDDVLGGKEKDPGAPRKVVSDEAEEELSELEDLTDDATLVDEQARAELERMAKMGVQGVRTETEIFDFFSRARPGAQDGEAKSPSGVRIARGRDERTITAGQLRSVTRIGVPPDEAKRMTFAQAARFINACAKRREAKLASYRQMAILKRWGVTDRTIPETVANEAIRYLASRRWERSADTTTYVTNLIASVTPGTTQPTEGP